MIMATIECLVKLCEPKNKYETFDFDYNIFYSYSNWQKRTHQ